jgi:hypothetical protein
LPSSPDWTSRRCSEVKIMEAFAVCSVTSCTPVIT